MTESGYPFVVKRWTRGTPLASATEVLRGASE
jgi:prolyl oligopeptidase